MIGQWFPCMISKAEKLAKLHNNLIDGSSPRKYSRNKLQVSSFLNMVLEKIVYGAPHSLTKL